MPKWIQPSRQLSSPIIAIFLRQLAMYLTAGISLFKACEWLEFTTDNVRLRRVIMHLQRDLLNGHSFSVSLNAAIPYLDTLTLTLIKTGEETGQLESSLDIAARRYEEKAAFKKRLKQALFYPSLVAMTAFITLLGMVIIVIPHFAELYASMNAPLPPITSSIIAIANSLVAQRYSLFATIFFLLLLLRYKRFQAYVVHGLVKVPGVGSFYRLLYTYHFIQHLYLTYSAGIPLYSAIANLQQSQHDQLRQLAFTLQSHLQSGTTLHDALYATHFFTPLTLQFIHVGETSGTLAHSLQKLVDFYRDDVDNKLRRFTSLIEPFCIATLGLIIGILVIGLYLPIIQSGKIF